MDRLSSVRRTSGWTDGIMVFGRLGARDASRCGGTSDRTFRLFARSYTTFLETEFVRVAPGRPPGTRHERRERERVRASRARVVKRAPRALTSGRCATRPTLASNDASSPPHYALRPHRGAALARSWTPRSRVASYFIDSGSLHLAATWLASRLVWRHGRSQLASFSSSTVPGGGAASLRFRHRRRRAR